MKRPAIIACGLICLFSSLSGAQSPDFAGPEKEHAFLKKFVGTWTTTAKCKMGPNAKPINSTSTTHARMLGDFWIINEIKGESMGTSVEMLQTIGYDAKKKKYIGTWVDSMLGHLWRYEGDVDEAGTTITLEAEGPNFLTGVGTAKYRDVYQFEADDRILATSFVLDEAGQWNQFVTGHSIRVNDKAKSIE